MHLPTNDTTKNEPLVCSDGEKQIVCYLISVQTWSNGPCCVHRVLGSACGQRENKYRNRKNNNKQTVVVDVVVVVGGVLVGWLVGWMLNVPATCWYISGRVSSDNLTCCHTQREIADPTFHPTQIQYTNTGPTSPSADPITPGA